ncbi:helicase-exonuclease AddAB subunit AddB [Caldibacillus lycopersici]|uniref:ATP-dependent helicase/deoxyribonuclease subunit B n=1 Tax=Perspicuibacillus lycopersici TaxID=1325689 RepID=A0AAE3ITJ7_9BACI|nr:helicase-exonuclease AddAB subunit AddB [Perspicuibacillus lycopersici]MCU9612479.1 helicase-exonuclease AddAB subunit AddB [Perspicuibacillus lycopersici]
MSLRFILGRSGSGKTSYIVKEMTDSLQENPQGNPIIYIVPDQMTFLSEYKLVTNPAINGMFRLQVFSLTRLAWRILQETGGISRLHINTNGINMLIRKIINDNKQQLRIFSQSADKFGFIDHIEGILTEFKRYCISPNELYSSREETKAKGDPALLDKLHDLSIIYQQFEEQIRDKYLASEDYLALLAEKITESTYLKDAEIYIDGFHSFTPQEYAVIEQLMKYSRRVTITLNSDQAYPEGIPDDLSLFRMTGGTYSTLYEIAEVQSIEMEEDVLLQSQVRFQHPSLAYLERHFEHLPASPYNGESNLILAEAVNPRAEVEGIGRKIISFVRDHNYRYRDIAILVRNGQAYQELFDTVFTDYQIPYYIDQKRMMLNHPLIELIRSTLEIINGYWRYDPVFRAVKTDLLFPLDGNREQLRERMDRLENYCLAYGIQGEKWTSSKRWSYRRFRGLDFDIPQTNEEKQMEQELNESRLLISAPILRLANRFKKAVDGRALSTALYLYLEELDIPAKLEKLQIEAEEQGNLLLARQHEQAWNSVMELLDQYVEMLGEEKVSNKQFAEIFEAGLESLHFSLVPPAMDQVLIADLELSRLSDIKIVFVIGVNDGVMPKKFQDEGVLTDEDREAMLASGVKIAPTSKERLMDEEFLAYKAFSSASHHLFVSYPLANEEGKAVLPSPYIKRLKDILPESRQYSFTNEPSELPLKEQMEYIVNWDITLTNVTNQLQAFKRKYPIAPIWWDSYNLLLESERKKEAEKVLSSLFFENKAERLTEETGKELYGETIQGSISRMELFNSCAFSHFLAHGLKLREREIFRLEAPDIGEMFHGALKHISDQIQENNLQWAKLTHKQIQSLVMDAVTKLAPKLQNEILMSSNRHQYIKRKLEKVILRATLVLSEHAKASGFSPLGMEVAFGPKGDLPPVQFQLKNGTKMELVGRIDRIDQAKNDRGVFLRVIDYKSSNRDLHLGEVYYGLALQMLTYLDILIRYSDKLVGQKASPAGVLYFHIHNPLIKSKKLLTVDEIEEEILKRFKMNGLVLSDPEVVRMMDETLESGESKIISAGLKKTDGTLTARSKAASEEEFTQLRQYVHQIFEKTGNEIVEGNVDIAPYKLKDKTPCTFCPFKSVCQFDETLKENNYRQLPSLKSGEALELVKGALVK